MRVPIPLSRLQRSAGGERYGDDVSITGVAIDSRSVKAGDLFVAIPGSRVDGHDYTNAAVRAGAVACLVEKGGASVAVPSLQVADCVRSLAALGSLMRDDYDGVVVGVTGSSGKTTAKNMIASVLAEAGPTLATAGNQNNELGVPLTLARLDGDTEFAVIEMGAAKPDDIAYLKRIARPTVSVLLNAGTAHLEAYPNEAGIADTKAQVLDDLEADDLAVINADQNWSAGWRDRSLPARCVTFGIHGDADYRATKINFQGFDGVSFQLAGRCAPRDVVSSIPGHAGVYNALAAIAVGAELGLTDKAIDRGLANVQPTAGRGLVRTGLFGARIVDDCYNANPDSMLAALDMLARTAGSRVFIMGGMLELGDRSAELHESVVRRAEESGVSRLFTVGAEARQAGNTFAGEHQHFADAEALIRYELRFGRGDTVLVKGSRGIGLEAVVSALVARGEDIAC